MSQNINQIFIANPASSMISTDLLYLGRSPYNTSDDFAITFANFVASIGTATATASTISKWDAHVNMSANNFLAGYQAIATAAATTTLTISSPYTTQFTGSTTQTCVMPVVTTLVLGTVYLIVNSSTGNVTVESSGTNVIQTMLPGTVLVLQCQAITGTTAASWNILYYTGALPGVVEWSGVSGTTQAASANAGYVIQNASQTTVTLPATAALGSVVSVRGLGAAGWILAANTGQTIKVDGQTSSSGGTVTSAGQYDSIDVTCVTANTTWVTNSVLSTGVTIA